MSFFTSVIISFLLVASGNLWAGNKSVYFNVDSYPERISTACRNGVAQLYDECADQSELLSKAIKKAQSTGKTVLVVYGAEWCIWCHVFDKFVKGHSRKFQYAWQYYDGDNLEWEMLERENRKAKFEAKTLNKFVAANFILVHIESYHSPNGAEAARTTGFDPDSFEYLPVIFSLNATGDYAAHMLAYDAIPGMEIRQDSGEAFRGFDREILLRELKKLRVASTK